MNYSTLQEGDLIRALITDEKLSKHNREHCFIVFSLHTVKDHSKRRHRICIPACSFSSKFPKCQNEIFLEINTKIIPPDLFNQKKDNTILRIGRPKCIEKYQFRGYVTNLRQYPDFWKELCEQVYEAFPEDLGNLNAVYDCQCLVDNNIEAGYCEQDEDYIVAEYCEESDEAKKICSCCGYRFEDFNYEFTECPVCRDNVYVIIVDEQGCECFIHNPDPQC